MTAIVRPSDHRRSTGKVAVQHSITITSGDVSAGTRIYQLKVQPLFDLSDIQSASEDVFTVSLFNPLTGKTVIDSGSDGSGAFALRGSQAQIGNGLVQWDGTFLSIDLTQIAVETLREAETPLAEPTREFDRNKACQSTAVRRKITPPHLSPDTAAPC